MGVLDRFRLDEKTAIVTGGNRGIGRAISHALGEAGSDIVIANRDKTSGEQAATEIRDEIGVQARYIQTDVTNEDDIKDLATQAVSEFESVDILVNNAGIARISNAEDMVEMEWNDVIDTNLKGAFLCSKYIGNKMLESNGGSIVNISSILAFRAAHPQRIISYTASKAGLEGLKRQLASEWAEDGVRVNNINPGYIRTDLVNQVLENRPELEDIWIDEMQFGEIATPEAIGPLAVYLASDASAYMTGTSIAIDGGYLVE
ncbi:SDR family NAD(P)-dependent oxidoreductase [Halocatena halophila]|uniref:SDR family NAD(P)-dependent oxidoreductase n=1 Tax=Halocatena halophila TaxID=2814576 RepID=UPI002ED37016